MAEQCWGFIINPVAGKGYARNYAETVRNKILQRHVDAEIRFTERRGHAVELADELARSGCRVIVAVGGDGTANETARGLLNHDDVTFGIVSAGTGNDFAPVLGFSEHFTDADWEVLFEGRSIRMDVGKCNENYFLNGMGLGYDAQVAAENYNPDGTLKERRGNYFWHIVKNLVLYKEKEFHIESDPVVRQGVTFMTTIGNGRRVGGGYYLTPKALADDGFLDVCVVEPLRPDQRLKLFFKAPSGRHVGHPKITYFRTNRLSVRFEKPVPHHLDGELFFAQNYEISVLPKKLKVLYNPKGDHFFDTNGRA